MSVIFRVEGLDAVLTFLISGSATASGETAPPASTASDDCSTLRRFMRNSLTSDILANPFPESIWCPHLTPRASPLVVYLLIPYIWTPCAVRGTMRGYGLNTIGNFATEHDTRH